MPEIEFIPAQPSDLDALVALRIEAMRESLERIGRFDPVRARTRFAQSFVPERTRKVVCAGTLCGVFVTRPLQDHLLLDHLYVLPAHQGLGIGAQVLTAVFDEAQALGLPVRVGALRESRSNAFYLRHGFRLVAQTEFDNHYLRPQAAA